MKKPIFLFWGTILAVAMVFAQMPAMTQLVPSVPATQEQAAEEQVAEPEQAVEQPAQAAEEEAVEQPAQAVEEEAVEQPAQAAEEEAVEQPAQAAEEEAAEQPAPAPQEQEAPEEQVPPEAPAPEEQEAPEEQQAPEEQEAQATDEQPWTCIFQDQARGTELRVNIDNKTFQFIASDGYDSGVVEATHMIVCDTSRGQFTFIRHGDSEIELLAFAVGSEEHRCITFAIDRETGQGYRLVDPPHHFMGRIFHS